MSEHMYSEESVLGTEPNPGFDGDAGKIESQKPEVPASPPGSVDWSKPRVAAILRAAVRCFARSGFDTTTAEIAAEIGIPKSVIYHYFDDKTTLVREAQRFAYADHLARVKEALAGIHERTGTAVVDTLRQIW